MLQNFAAATRFLFRKIFHSKLSSTFQPLRLFLNLNIAAAWSALEEGDEGSFKPNCQEN